MTKRLANIALFIGMILGIAMPAAAQQSNVLTTLNFDIVGVGVEASPEYQAVPKGIASLVNTSYVANGSAAPADLVSLLPRDYRVMADLSGPSITGVLSLSTPPGQPFLLPSLPLLGKHTLSNIRVADAAGNLLFSATPQAVSIESITDPLITSVITRQLSLEEIRDLTGTVLETPPS